MRVLVRQRPLLAGAALVVAATLVPVSAQQERKSISTRCTNQRGRLSAIEGDGDRELADRRLRAPAHELARLPQVRRLGRQGDDVLGPREREAAAVRPVRPRLGERQVLHDGDDARRKFSGHRLSTRMVDEHERRPYRARPIVATIETPEDMATWKGKLKGKFVLATAAGRRAGALRPAGQALHRRTAPRSSASPTPPAAADGRAAVPVAPSADAARRRPSRKRARSSSSTRAFWP